MQFLEFTFSSFWVFLGVLLLIAITLNGVADIVAAWRRKP